jgi:hypothetical protein
MDAKKLKSLEGFFASDPSDVLVDSKWFDSVVSRNSNTPLTSINTSPEVVDNLVKALSDISKGTFNPSKYTSMQEIEELWRNIYQSGMSNSLDELLRKLETVTQKGLYLSSLEDKKFTTMKKLIETQGSFLVNVKDILDTSPASKVSEERVDLETSDTRSDQARHPDHGVGFYEGSRFFPMTRPMSAIWLCCIMAISMFFILLALGIFLRFAHIEIDIKTPFGGGAASTLSAIGDTPPKQYTAVIGGAAAAGILGAYMYYLLKPRVVTYLKL